MRINPIGSNMTELILNNGDVVLFSYETPVAARTTEGGFKTTKKWSVTTSRHITKWDAKHFKERPQEWFDALVG